VTYQLWSTIYTWATDNARGANKYTFANPGSRGGHIDDTITYKVFTSGHGTDPVTTINWRDAIVWCNALTEYYNAQNKTSLGCVYKDTGGNVIRDSTKADPVIFWIFTFLPFV
jgi:hypothetical protein